MIPLDSAGQTLGGPEKRGTRRWSSINGLGKLLEIIPRKWWFNELENNWSIMGYIYIYVYIYMYIYIYIYIYICIYTYIWVNSNDRTLWSRSLESWFMLGKSSPFMAELFRLVNIIIYPEWLSGGWEHGFYDFPFSWEFPSIPTDELHLFSEGLKLPTNQLFHVTTLGFSFHKLGHNWLVTGGHKCSSHRYLYTTSKGYPDVVRLQATRWKKSWSKGVIPNSSVVVQCEVSKSECVKHHQKINISGQPLLLIFGVSSRESDKVPISLGFVNISQMSKAFKT